MVKKSKIIKIKGTKEARPLGFDQKIFPGVRDLAILKNLPGDGNAWN